MPKLSYRTESATALKPHPLARLVPRMRPHEWDEFYADIALRGIKVPLEIDGEGIILDGHHRWKAAIKLGIPVPVVDAPLSLGEDSSSYMLKAAVLRRHLSDDQRGMMAALWMLENKATPGPKAADLVPAQRAAEITDNNPTRQQATQTFNVSRQKVDRSRYVQNRAPELASQVHNGNIALNNAYRQVHGAEERQRIASTQPPLGMFQVLVIDPPWPYVNRQDDPSHQSTVPYQTMTIEELKGLTIPHASDAILWLWTTNTFLREAFTLLDSWGFIYRTMLTWVKNSVGLGDWLGGQTEHCLLATKGNYKIFRNNESTAIHAPRQGHSVKPDAFYAMVEGLCPGQRIDMFGRKERTGWTIWGAEAPSPNTGD